MVILSHKYLLFSVNSGVPLSTVPAPPCRPVLEGSLRLGWGKVSALCTRSPAFLSRRQSEATGSLVKLELIYCRQNSNYKGKNHIGISRVRSGQPVILKVKTPCRLHSSELNGKLGLIMTCLRVRKFLNNFDRAYFRRHLF